MTDNANDTEIIEHDPALEEAQRMVAMQAVTISALQNRIWQLEMELVDQMSASLAAAQGATRVTVATPITRLFTKPITLIKRVETSEDSWGNPVYAETATEVLGYYRQIRTGDQDMLAATVVWENMEVYLPADTDPGPYDAVEVTIHGRTERMEIIGQAAEEWNARIGQVNHLKMLVRRAAP